MVLRWPDRLLAAALDSANGVLQSKPLERKACSHRGARGVARGVFRLRHGVRSLLPGRLNMPEATTVLLPNRAVRQSAQRTLSDIARQRMIECEHGGVVRADWLDMVFLHFEVEPKALQEHTPFELDLFDGRAFVSLVAFVMR